MAETDARGEEGIEAAATAEEKERAEEVDASAPTIKTNKARPPQPSFGTIRQDKLDLDRASGEGMAAPTSDR